MKSRRHLRSGALSCAALFASAAFTMQGCDHEQPAGEPGGGGPARPFCVRWDALAQEVGCVPLGEECEPLPTACEALAGAFLDCVARDLSQCLCESDDGALNCEGSFKPDEGPARCREQYRRFDACLGEE